MEFALLTVSYSGLFYDGEALSVVDQIRKARTLGFDGLSIETKRPVASPLDLSSSDRAEIKNVAASEGIALCALESLSNFASPFMEARENNLAMMKELIRLASDLEIDLIKVFAAWPGLKEDTDQTAVYGDYEHSNYYDRDEPSDLRRWNRAVRGIREAADWAAERGITLALQNHLPVTSPGYEDALAMMQEIGRDNVKLCLDVPLFYERQSEEYIREAVQNCGDHIVHTHYGAWNFTRDDSGTIVQEASPAFGGTINYESYVRELQKAGYEGFLVSEYCLPAVVDHEIAGIEEIDRATEMALAYMKNIVNEPVAR